MRILVTGGAGFIGSHLIRRLLAKGEDDIVNLDALRYSGNPDNLSDVADHPRYRFVQGDICEPKTVTTVFEEYEIEAVINCAAENHVDRCLLDPQNFYRTNVLGTGLLLEEARMAAVQRFVQVSTDEVYGSQEEGVASEDELLHPRNPYAASKAGADLLVSSYWTTCQLPVLITRGSNTYGSHQYPEKLVPLFITNALLNEPLPLYGDGRQRRDWLSVEDHCAGIETVLRKGAPGTTYNISAGNERENLWIAKQILTHLDKPLDLIRFVLDRPGHDRRYAMGADRIRALGWRPEVELDEGLRRTVEWYARTPQWWRKARSGKFETYYTVMYRERLEHGRPYEA